MFYRNGLKFNVNYNCRKCLGALFSIFQRFGCYSKTILYEIIFTK